MSASNNLNKIAELSILLMLIGNLVVGLMSVSVGAEENQENPLTGRLDTVFDDIKSLNVVENGGSLVNFDDISLPPDAYQQILIYAGITWDSGLPDYWGHYDGGWWATNDLSYATPVSPPNYVFNGYGAIDPGFSFASQVNFDGAYFMKTTAVSNPSAVRFVGYVSSVPTYYSEWLSLTSAPTYLSAEFPGVDRVVVEMQGSGWFAMDDLSYEVAIQATVDIEPDTLNLKSKGKWITAYIQLPEEHNPENIDATTILLNHTIQPVLDPKYGFVTNSNEYLVDHNEDGILERMVRFDRAQVMVLLSVGEGILTITGEVNGISFEGSDTITVI